jgi:hypothetical protein
MARNFANIVTAIWRDEAFIALRAGAQRMYLLLCTQPDISACGLLHLRTRRWSRLAADTSQHDVEVALKELEVARLVVVDDDTEEVLVRSFTRYDNGYANPRRQPSIRDAADAVESPAIMAVLAAEFDRLGLPAQWRGQAKITNASTDSQSNGYPIADPAAIESQSASRSGSAPRHPHGPSGGGAPRPDIDDGADAAKPQVDSHSDSHRIGHDVSMECLTVSRRRVPQPTTHNPQPVSELRSSTARARTTRDEARQASKTVALIVASAGATADEARRVLRIIHERSDVRNEFGLVRAMLTEGTLQDLLGELRDVERADFNRRYHHFTPDHTGDCTTCPMPEDHWQHIHVHERSQAA